MSSEREVKAAGGIAPFGFRWQSGSLVVDPAEAPVRKLMYELFLKHRRKKTVAKILNQLGHKTRRGSEFYDITVERLIRDPTAKGIRMVDGNEVAIDPIVTTEIWELSNAILAGTAKTKVPNRLFSGVVYCDCGPKMSAKGDSDRYACPDCRRKIRCDDLEEIFESQLQKYADGGDAEIYEQWGFIGEKDKRILVEQLCEKIVVCRTEIKVQLAAVGPRPVGPGEEPGELRDQRKPPDTVVLLEDALLSESEAARFLGVSKMTLLRKRKAGEIGFFTVGHRISYSRIKHLLPFLEAKENVATG